MLYDVGDISFVVQRSNICVAVKFNKEIQKVNITEEYKIYII